MFKILLKCHLNNFHGFSVLCQLGFPPLEDPGVLETAAGTKLNWYRGLIDAWRQFELLSWSPRCSERKETESGFFRASNRLDSIVNGFRNDLNRGFVGTHSCWTRKASPPERSIESIAKTINNRVKCEVDCLLGKRWTLFLYSLSIAISRTPGSSSGVGNPFLR